MFHSSSHSTHDSAMFHLDVMFQLPFSSISKLVHGPILIGGTEPICCTTSCARPDVDDSGCWWMIDTLPGNCPICWGQSTPIVSLGDELINPLIRIHWHAILNLANMQRFEKKRCWFSLFKASCNFWVSIFVAEYMELF